MGVMVERLHEDDNRWTLLLANNLMTEHVVLEHN